MCVFYPLFELLVKNKTLFDKSLVTYVENITQYFFLTTNEKKKEEELTLEGIRRGPLPPLLEFNRQHFIFNDKISILKTKP